MTALDPSPGEAEHGRDGKLIKKLAVAALVALIAAPAFSMHQLGLPGMEAASLAPDAGARLVSIGALLSTGLI